MGSSTSQQEKRQDLNTLRRPRSNIRSSRESNIRSNRESNIRRNRESNIRSSRESNIRSNRESNIRSNRESRIRSNIFSSQLDVSSSNLTDSWEANAGELVGQLGKMSLIR